MKSNMLKLIVAIVLVMVLSVSYMMPYCYASSPADEKKNFRDLDKKSMNNYNEYVNSQKNVNTKTTTGSGEFNPGDYKPDSTTQVTNGDELAKAGSKIMGTVMSIASVIAVLTFSIIGIKYMLGSVEEKAQYKKTLFPYLVGAIMVFGITSVIQIISAVAGNIPS